MLGLAAAVGLVLSFLIWFYYSQRISGQNTRNQFLQGEITKVEGKIKEIEVLDKQKDRLLARKKVIEELQANRSQMVHLFDSLVRTIPDGVALAGIKQEGDILTLEGRSQSNARVSTYMRNLESSGWMTNPDLSIIEAKAEDKAAPGASSGQARALPYAFSLQVKLANPAAVEEGAEPTAATVTADAAAAAAPATTPPAAGSPASAPATPPAATPAPAAPAPAATPAEKPAPATQGRPAS